MALMPVADALAAVLAGAEPLPEEMVALDTAFHRVLARDVPSAQEMLEGHLHSTINFVYPPANESDR